MRCHTPPSVDCCVNLGTPAPAPARQEGPLERGGSNCGFTELEPDVSAERHPIEVPFLHGSNRNRSACISGVINVPLTLTICPIQRLWPWSRASRRAFGSGAGIAVTVDRADNRRVPRRPGRLARMGGRSCSPPSIRKRHALHSNTFVCLDSPILWENRSVRRGFSGLYRRIRPTLRTAP